MLMTDFVTIKKDSPEMQAILNAFQAWFDSGFIHSPWTDREDWTNGEETFQTLARLGLVDKIKNQQRWEEQSDGSWRVVNIT